jgi:hypothetical protein
MQGRLSHADRIPGPCLAVLADLAPHLAFARYLTGLLGRPTVNPGEVLGWHELAPSSAR